MGQRHRERVMADQSPGYRYVADGFRQASESAYREPYGKGQQYGEGRYGQGECGSADYQRGAYRGGYEERFGGASYGRDTSEAGEYSGAAYSSVAGGYDNGNEPPRAYEDIYGAYPGRGAYGRTNPDYGALSYRDYGEYWHSPYTDAYSRYEDADNRAGRSPRERRQQRAPKGYTRSDERIEEMLWERLWRSAEIDLSEVTLEVKDGKVTFSGKVPQRWMRYAIEDIADDCFGVQEIFDAIRVESPHERRV